MEDREKKAQQLPGRLVVLAIVALVVGLLSLFGLVVAFRSNSLWGILLLPLAIPAVLVTCAIIVRQLSGKGVGDARIRAKQA